MLSFDFARIFKLKSIHRPFTFLQTIGYSAGYATKLANNRVYEINLVRLEKFCRDFDCTPNDILNFRPRANDDLPANHRLRTLIKEPVNDFAEKISQLSPDKIQKIHDLIKNME